MQLTSYSIYTRTFAKVASGAKVTESDFGVLRLRRFLQPFDQAGQVAVAVAVQDAAKDAGLKSRAEFDAELKRLLSWEPGSMPRPLLRPGAQDEIFVMGKLGVEIDISGLIARINATPVEELEILEVETAPLLEAAQDNGYNPLLSISEERMDEPILLMTLPAEDDDEDCWVIDGTHRLHARHRAGKPSTLILVVRPRLLEGLVQAR